MASQQVFFRLGEQVIERLDDERQEGETINQTAQRLLTALLTGEEVQLGKPGRPKGSKKATPLTLEERVKLLEDRIFGDDK